MKNLFNDKWKDYFYLHKRLRKGFIFLFSILSVEIIVLLYLHFIPVKNQPQDSTKFDADVEKFLASAQASKDEDVVTDDPPQRDFKKEQAKPLKSTFTYTPQSNHYPSREFLVVDISTADTTDLEKLKGIGPVKARTIYRYREKLGGFYSINQLHEVWGMNDSLFESLQPHLTLSDSLNLRKIKVNEADVVTLGKHPYIGFNLARVMVSYRKEHGPFHSLSDLQKIPLINAELYYKIAHYLTVRSD